MTMQLSTSRGAGRLDGLRIDVQQRAEATWITARGELHAGTATDLDDLLREAWSGPGKRVCLDVGQLRVLDSSVVMISVWKRDAKDHGVEFRLINAQATVQPLLELLAPAP